MSDQPIIIEEQAEKHLEIHQKEIDKDLFFELFDEVEEYDRISTTIRQKYREAMVKLASVKFDSPHSLSVSSQKCVPAFLKLSSQGNLTYGYTEFTAKVDSEEVYPDQYQEHQQIEQFCLQKQTQLSEAESKEVRQQKVENELLRRFNVANKQQKVLGISNQFKEVIELLLELQQFKASFEPKLQTLEKRER